MMVGINNELTEENKDILIGLFYEFTNFSGDWKEFIEFLELRGYKEEEFFDDNQYD